MTADSSLKFLNTWQNQEGMSNILVTLAVIGPPEQSDKTQPDLTAALQVYIMLSTIASSPLAEEGG